MEYNARKEPTVEEYGLDVFSYENYRIQKKDLEKNIEETKEKKEKEIKEMSSRQESIVFGLSCFLGFLIIFSSSEKNITESVLLSIPLGILILIVGFIILSIFNIDLFKNWDKELNKNTQNLDNKITELKEKINYIKNKILPFEESYAEYYMGFLSEKYFKEIYEKRSDSDIYKKSLAEFLGIINEVDEINKKLLFKNISTYKYKSYLEEQKISHTVIKYNELNSLNKLKMSQEIVDIKEENLKKAVLTKKVAESIFKALETKDNFSPGHSNNILSVDDKEKEGESFSVEPTKDIAPDINVLNNSSSEFKDIINTIDSVSPDKKYNTPRKIDWENINKNKSITGLKGEEIVFEIEKNYLKSINKEDLAEKVKHMSLEGDGSGYDILSFFPDGQEKYIEVKSSKNSSGNSFNISSNELDFMKRNQNNYHIYQVFNINDNEETPTLKVHRASDILEFKKITPVQYVVKIE